MYIQLLLAVVLHSLEILLISITQIQKGDGYPATICSECKQKAIGAYDFKTKCEEAHISLQGILGKERNEFFLHIKPMCQVFVSQNFVKVLQ